MITKYGHACLVIDKNGHRIVVDPGGLTVLPAELSNVDAIVVTHEHFDHCSPDNVKSIISQNPEVVLYGVSSTIEACADGIECKKIIVSEDQSVKIGDFELTFYYGDHAVIHETSPCKNIGIKIDDELYYPGDSLRTVTDKVKVIAVPTCAPWLKATEFMSFVRNSKADFAIPTHNGMLNAAGQETFNAWLQRATDGTDIELNILNEGDSL